MSVVPERWSDPGSPAGLVYELAWLSLLVVFFGLLAVFEPFSIDVSPTRDVLVASLGLGALVGVGFVGLSVESERVRSFWADDRWRLVAIFAVAMAMQGLLWFAPTWTVLGTIAAALAAIPTRLALYRRHRGEANDADGT